MKQNLRKTLAVLLSLTMLLSMAGVSALAFAKEHGGGAYCLYQPAMSGAPSAITPIAAPTREDP